MNEGSSVICCAFVSVDDNDDVVLTVEVIDGVFVIIVDRVDVIVSVGVFDDTIEDDNVTELDGVLLACVVNDRVPDDVPVLEAFIDEVCVRLTTIEPVFNDVPVTVFVTGDVCVLVVDIVPVDDLLVVDDSEEDTVGVFDTVVLPVPVPVKKRLLVEGGE